MIASNVDSFSAVHALYKTTHDIKPVTIEQTDICVRLFEAWHLAAKLAPLTLATMSESLLCEFLFYLRDKGRSPRTCNGKRGQLLTLWKFARKKGLAPAFDPADVIRFREPERIPDAWSQLELARLLQACKTYHGHRVAGWTWQHDQALILTIYDTAFRVSACLALRFADLGPDGTIVAAADTQKTNCDEEKFLGLDTLQAIYATVGKPRELIFPWPYQKKAFWGRWKKLLTHAGLPHTRRDGPQKLRRTSVSHLEAARPGTAQHHLRHKTAGLATRHYLDPRVAYQYKAAELLPRIPQA